MWRSKASGRTRLASDPWVTHPWHTAAADRGYGYGSRSITCCEETRLSLAGNGRAGIPVLARTGPRALGRSQGVQPRRSERHIRMRSIAPSPPCLSGRGAGSRRERPVPRVTLTRPVKRDGTRGLLETLQIAMLSGSELTENVDPRMCWRRSEQSRPRCWPELLRHVHRERDLLRRAAEARRVALLTGSSRSWCSAQTDSKPNVLAACKLRSYQRWRLFRWTRRRRGLYSVSSPLLLLLENRQACCGAAAFCMGSGQNEGESQRSTQTCTPWAHEI